jgi:long-chain acyl-CoA synthetase
MSEEGGNRIEEVLEESRPFYMIALSAFFKVFFFVYDTLVFLPFKLFADPEKKKALSEREKAKPTVEGDPSSPWRHVDTIGKELKTRIFPDCYTLGAVWDRAVEMHPDDMCMGWREVQKAFEEKQSDGRSFQKFILGEYNWLDYSEVDDRITSIACGLSSFGIKKGNKIVIYAETRKEWMMTAIACFKLGIPVVTVYATLGEEAVNFAIKECDAVAVVTTKSLLSKVSAAVKDVKAVEKIIYFFDAYRNPDEPQEASEKVIKEIKQNGREVYTLDELINKGDELEYEDVEVEADDMAMVMYTSDTTGNPKGVMLSHKNILAALTGQSAVIDVDNNDTVIGYLPLAHILEVCVEMVCIARGTRIGYSSAQTLFDRAPKIQKGSKGDCAALKPTLMACVPAVMDRIFKAVTDEVKQSNVIARELFRICYERKRARYEEGYRSLVMNRLAFDRIRKLLGGKLRYVLSGGAPLNAETQRFMNICFCCPVVQGYGLTETCGGGTLADANDLSTGTVGPPLRCCEIKLREWADAGYSPKNDHPQGEILIGGDNVALGYYKNEEKTKEDFIEEDGVRWFCSGDVGEFRADGSLRIIDRKKDLIKLSHGEYISLGKVETTLLTNSLIDNICVYGNSEQDYLIGLVVPNEKNIKELAKNNGVDGDLKKICSSKEVREAVANELQSHAKGKLQRAEIPKKVWLCDEAWTPASGLLTEALKLKRKNIEKAFEKEIQQLYKSK